MENNTLVTKFVQHEVPKLEMLKNSKVYQLREKLNNGEKLARAEKDWITEAVNQNIFFKNAVPLHGYRFSFEDVLRTYLVKQWGGWREYKAIDKTGLRNFIYGRIDNITEITN